MNPLARRPGRQRVKAPLSEVIITIKPPLQKKTPPCYGEIWENLRFGSEKILRLNFIFPFGNHRFLMQNRSKMTYKSSKFSPAAPISSKTMSYECIPYINTVKTAPKAPKILRVFVPKQKKTPPCFGAVENKGGFYCDNYLWWWG